MSTPTQSTTLLELCAKATPGPRHVVKCGTPEMFHHVHGVACVGDHFVETDHKQGHEPSDAQLIARLSPDVARAVYEALKAGTGPLHPADNRGECLCSQCASRKGFDRAICLLDGKEDAT